LKINIKIETDSEPRESLEEKVDSYILRVESSENSEFEWEYLKYLYKKLSKCQVPENLNSLFLKLKETIIKHGKYDNDSELLNGEDMFKGQDLDNGYSLEDYE